MSTQVLGVPTVQTDRLQTRQSWWQALVRRMPSSGATKEIAPVDGLRGVAIILVVWTHIAYFAQASGAGLGPDGLFMMARFGFCGVYLFFVLSGFLLFLPYARAMISGKPMPLARKFYLRRALRILPLFYISVSVLLLFSENWLLMDHKRTLVLTALMFHDMDPAAFTALNGPFWTLAIEWQFYLLLPVLAFALSRFAGRSSSRWFYWRLAVGLLALVAFGLGVRWMAADVYYVHGQIPATMPHGIGLVFMILYGCKGKALETFALGMGVSVLYVAVLERGHVPRALRYVIALLGVGAAGGILAYCEQWAITDDRYTNFVWARGEGWQLFGEWMLGVAFVCLLLATLVLPQVLGRLFAFAPLRFIGIISYSIYVWHFSIVQALVGPATTGHLGSGYVRLLVLSAVVIMLFCTVSYYLIERPFIRYRRRAHTTAEVQLAAAYPN